MAFQFNNSEESWLNLQIKLAEQKGFIDFNESEKFLNDLINDSD